MMVRARCVESDAEQVALREVVVQSLAHQDGFALGRLRCWDRRWRVTIRARGLGRRIHRVREAVGRLGLRNRRYRNLRLLLAFQWGASGKLGDVTFETRVR